MAKFSRSINREAIKAFNKRSFNVIGLMSGTSVDGIDVAVLQTDGLALVKTGAFASYPYTAAFRKKVKAAFGKRKAPAVEKELTVLHARAVNHFLKTHKMKAGDFDCIGFHGQTIAHNPAKGYTVQIGDGKLLHKLTDIPVVYDFRSDDVKAGGQGAPLVPVYHQALAAKQKKPTVFLNIGGLANITYVGAKGELLATDTGPGNAMIDDWVLKHTKRAYDKDGALAAKGTVDEAFVRTFLKHPFFKKKMPKSLDRNAFTACIPDHLNAADGAATLTQMMVEAIAVTLKLCPKKPSTIIVCGGGRKNRDMMRRLHLATGAKIVPIETMKLDGDATEAQAFAYLAVREILGLPISFKGTTGRKKP
ncbi:MAG: anhydro-N-acetylmuramic acid kinase [Alphaproteobacteria bacterium]|nr:anhydro-N-acetylmuramic acid kinase [Alphaproteobacteria bacterium]